MPRRPPKTSSRRRCAVGVRLQGVGARADGGAGARRSSPRYPYPRSADRHAYVVFIEKDEVRDELLAVELDPKVEQAEAGEGVVYWTVPKGDTLDSAMGKAQGASQAQAVADDAQPQHAREAHAVAARPSHRPAEQHPGGHQHAEHPVDERERRR